MVAQVRQSARTSEYRAWEGLIRAACASAAVQSPEAVRAINVSHRSDQLSSDERGAIIAFADGFAHDKGLELEIEELPSRIAFRFSKREAIGPDVGISAEPLGSGLRALWQGLFGWHRE